MPPEHHQHGGAMHEMHSMHEAAQAGEVHSMAGIPLGLAIAGIALMIVCTHLLLWYLPARREAAGGFFQSRFNVLKFGPLRALVGNAYFPTLIQFVSILLLFLIVGAGLFGSSRVNIAPVLTWTWWWILLVFLVLTGGKAFCSICPWEGLTSIVTSLSLKSRVKKIGFELKWPRFLRNIYPAILLFIGLTWLELGVEITKSPSRTALVAMGMTGMAVLGGIFFEKRAFCRYGCLVGRISGIYALFAPVELRPMSADVCRSCTGKPCLNGSESEVGCPLHLFPGNLSENTYCTLCTACVRSCPSDNIAFNLRPFAVDLREKKSFRNDEAVMAIVLLSLTGFHGLTMTPLWGQISNQLRVASGLGPLPVFTLLMSVMLALPFALFWACARASKILARTRTTVARILAAFAYSLIPVALFYHLAHNSMHFFMEALNIVPLLSDPFGYGWNLLGTAGKDYGSILSLRSIWYIQIVLIVIGHLFGVLIAERISKRLFADDPRAGRLSLIPMMIAMILFSSFSVWLIAQPMEMRTGM